MIVRLFAVQFFLLFTIGCQSESDRVYPISGTVVFEDGTPAKFGIIEFRSDSNTPIVARGKIKKDGTFRVKASGKSWGLTAGKHDVVVLQVVGNPRGRPKIVHSHGLEVADKYRSYETSDLQAQVTPKGDNKFKILVESKN